MISRRTEEEESWTVGRLLAWTEQYFRGFDFEAPRLDAELLLAEALGMTRLELYTNYKRPVDGEERTRFRVFVERRSRREPVAYILGRREFYSLIFEVSPAVLIPRPETEHLVDVVLERFREAVGAGRILDLGTGCGAIAVAVVVNALGATADVVDLSREALELAERNSEAHGVKARMRFFAGDLCEAIPVGSGPYSVIVSNPPYVSIEEYPQLMADVRAHEPRLALVDDKSPGGDGLGFYRELAATVGPWLDESGMFAVEIGDGQSRAVQRILEEAGWRVEEVAKDLGGIDRVIVSSRA